MPTLHSITLKTIAASAMLVSASATFAHEGHGLTGPHGHATDVWGFIALGAMVALGIWLSRGRK